MDGTFGWAHCSGWLVRMGKMFVMDYPLLTYYTYILSLLYDCLAELRGCVKVKVDVLGSSSLIQYNTTLLSLCREMC